MLGLVVSNVLFIAAFILLIGVLVEWMVLAWSDRATGDPEANRSSAARLMGPYEVPLLGVLLAGGTVAALSRVLLTSSKEGAVWVATGIGAVVFLIGLVIAARPKLSANAVAGALVVAALGVVTAGRRSRPAGASATSRSTTPEEHEVTDPRATGHASTRSATTAGTGLEANIPAGTAAGHHDHHGGRGLTPSPNGPVRRRRGWRAPRSRSRCSCALGACAENAPLDTLKPKGPEARDDRQPVNPVFLIAGVVFVVVQVGVLFLAWRFRKRKDDDGSLPPQIHGNTKLELGWTIIPALILAGVGVATVLTILDLDETPDDASRSTSSASSGGGSSATTSTTTARTTSSPPTTWSSRPASRSTSPSPRATSSTASGSRRSTASATPCPAATTRWRSRPTSPASSGASAPSSAACPTPTCACRSIALDRGRLRRLAGEPAAARARPHRRGRR